MDARDLKRLIPCLWHQYGAGAARAVSRRYIADFVPKAGRTRASAAFVGSAALGMALGPLLTRVFHSFPTVHAGPVSLNGITLSGCALSAPVHVHIQACT